MPIAREVDAVINHGSTGGAGGEHREMSGERRADDENNHCWYRWFARGDYGQHCGGVDEAIQPSASIGKCLGRGEPTMKTIIVGIDGSHAAITASIVGFTFEMGDPKHLGHLLNAVPQRRRCLRRLPGDLGRVARFSSARDSPSRWVTPSTSGTCSTPYRNVEGVYDVYRVTSGRSGLRWTSAPVETGLGE